MPLATRALIEEGLTLFATEFEQCHDAHDPLISEYVNQFRSLFEGQQPPLSYGFVNIKTGKLACCLLAYDFALKHPLAVTQGSVHVLALHELFVEARADYTHGDSLPPHTVLALPFAATAPQFRHLGLLAALLDRYMVDFLSNQDFSSLLCGPFACSCISTVMTHCYKTSFVYPLEDWISKKATPGEKPFRDIPALKKAALVSFIDDEEEPSSPPVSPSLLSMSINSPLSLCSTSPTLPSASSPPLVSPCSASSSTLLSPSRTPPTSPRPPLQPPLLAPLHYVPALLPPLKVTAKDFIELDLHAISSAQRISLVIGSKCVDIVPITPQMSEELVELFMNGFADEPMVHANPLITSKDFREYLRYYVVNTPIISGTAFAALDPATHEIVAASLGANDYVAQPDPSQFMNMTAWGNDFALLHEVGVPWLKSIGVDPDDPKYRGILAEATLIACKPNWRGGGFASITANALCRTCKRQGYKYLMCFASNFYSARAFRAGTHAVEKNFIAYKDWISPITHTRFYASILPPQTGISFNVLDLN